MLIKVLDGCGINDRFWVFAAATTDVETTLRVTDSQTGRVATYFNPLANASPAVTDVDALAGCSQGAGVTAPSRGVPTRPPESMKFEGRAESIWSATVSWIPVTTVGRATISRRSGNGTRPF